MISSKIKHSDSAKQTLLLKYPKGEYAYSTEIAEIIKEKNAEIFEDKLNAVIKKFSYDDQKKADAQRLSYPYTLLSRAFIRSGNMES